MNVINQKMMGHNGNSGTKNKSFASEQKESDKKHSGRRYDKEETQAEKDANAKMTTRGR
jgi:hypothetical protein